MDLFRVRARGGQDRVLEEYIEAVYDAHEARIYGLALSMTRDPDSAADVVQDAFIRLTNEARDGRYPDNPGAWLYRTASNLAVSRARRIAVARRFAPRLLRGDSPATPEGLTLERERSQVMRDVLATLPVTQRTALVLSAQGMRGEEIAAHLGMNHAALRTMLTRARRRLRQGLVDRGAE
jgi:RNA polymerase sigma-70 factor, ECF subfamily